MVDDLLKTLVLGAPNFVGFIVLAFVLTRYVIMPMMAHHEAQDRLIFDLAMRLADCGNTTVEGEHVKSAERVFSGERSAARQEEKTELLT